MNWFKNIIIFSVVGTFLALPSSAISAQHKRHHKHSHHHTIHKHKSHITTVIPPSIQPPIEVINEENPIPPSEKEVESWFPKEGEEWPEVKPDEEGNEEY